MARKDSETALLNAVETLLLAGKPVGVNTVASESGINKALIYRYFGSFDGLLTAFSNRINLWRGIRETLEQKISEGDLKDVATAVKWLFSEYRKQLQLAPLYAQVLRIEINERNPLTVQLETDREEEGLRVSQLMAKHFSSEEADAMAIGAIMSAGLTYLVLRSRDIRWFNGLDLNEERDWERIENALVNLF
jgi:AcrR family transcriptional regulator